MDANELMIGDLVQYNGVTCKVYCIESPFERKNDKYNNKFVITFWCNGFIDATEDEVKPIPLTEEILKANGFTERAHLIYQVTAYGRMRSFLFVHPYSGDVNGRLTLVPNNEGVTLHIEYVHELQHVLRLCGFNKLADNFKIELLC